MEQWRLTGLISRKSLGSNPSPSNQIMKVKGKIPSVILINPKYPSNVGQILRACSCYGVDQLWWTGDRVSNDPTQEFRLPREERFKGYKMVEMHLNEKPLDAFDTDIVPVSVEILPHSEPLTTFEHPEKAVYIFGPEDKYIPQTYRRLSHRFVHIPTHHCLNLSNAVATVLYDRRMKRQLAGLEPVLNIKDMLLEDRAWT